MKLNFILYFVLYSSYGIIINSQNPVDFTAKCEPYSGSSACRGYIYNLDSIYITSTYTQVNAQYEIDSLLALIDALPPTCAVPNTFKLMCNQYFQPCVNVTLDGSYQNETVVYLNRRVCKDDCEAGNTACGTSVSCDGQYDPSPAGTIVKFPVTQNQYNLSSFGGPANFQLPCLNVEDFSGSGDVTSVCFAPLIARNTTDRAKDIENGYLFLGDLDCLLPCPAPFFSDHQWEVFKNLTSITGMISLCCVFFNVFTYGILNKKHDRHTMGILFLSFSLFMCMISDIILASGGWSVSCPEPGKAGRQNDAACAANGILFQYGAVSTTLNWATMAFDLWLVIRKVRPSVSYVKYYITIINAITIILTIAPIFDKQYGYANGGVGCWILSDRWQNGVFWVPLTIALLAGTTFICLVIYEIYKIVKNVGSGSKRVFHLNLRPFVIILFIFGEYIYLFIYHFYTQRRMDGYYQNVTDYVYCIQMRGSNCETHTVSFGGQFVFLFFLRLLGIEVLIFYGINSRTKRIWQQSFLANNMLSRYFKSKFDSFTTSKNMSSQQSSKPVSVQSKGASQSLDSSALSVDNSMDSDDDDSDEGGGLSAPGVSLGRYRSVNPLTRENGVGGGWRTGITIKSWRPVKDPQEQ
ncbi:G-protein-coupled receptor family protein [Tieghemostelium lacteum]|uniref:G-protein-coupled receptor family protein n=1 Tax=Tieghemostelium lacteum TaxID=361077 RepID=A0A151Z880_TIELA|nr:G-protein-coupled receptor family protein [Tieghemostelium lacteum]|eukprot:KYQ90147.1 G-protein-coupled receptor family protein [Tieghemostelium lacteum]